MKSRYEITTIKCFNCKSEFKVSYFELVTTKSKIKCSKCNSYFEIDWRLSSALKGKLLDLDTARYEVYRALAELLDGSKKVIEE